MIAAPPDPAEQEPAGDTSPAEQKQQPAPGDGWVEVYVPPADLGDTARTLLDAAGEDPVDVDKVQTLSGGFRVPRDIADRAGVSPTDDNAVNPAATGTQAAFAPSPEPVSGDAVIKVEADRGTASREAVGAVFDPPTEPVSGDAVIQGEADSGNASPEAVGAVFAQNSPTGEGADANADDDAQPQPEPEADDAQAEADEEPQPEEQSEEDLRGEDLDDALRAAGLSAYGRVADKRARLAAHRAAHGG
jgi:hypothetical protein